jgi:hypothetical protein
MTPTEIRTLHGYTTLRILYFPFPGETPDYTAYTHAHFPVFTAEKSWRTLCSQLVTHNISVLYGDVPRTLGKCLQWYMGIAQQIVQPVIIRRPLPESPQDVLHNYRQARS